MNPLIREWKKLLSSPDVIARESFNEEHIRYGQIDLWMDSPVDSFQIGAYKPNNVGCGSRYPLGPKEAR